MRNDYALEVLGMTRLYPEAHDQSMWVKVPGKVGLVAASRLATEPACGTRLCWAGWEAALRAPEGTLFSSEDTRGMYVPDPDGELYLIPGAQTFMHGGTIPEAEGTVHYRRVSIEGFAAESQGLDSDQANELFNEANSDEDLLAMVRLLMAHPDATADELVAAAPDRDDQDADYRG